MNGIQVDQQTLMNREERKPELPREIRQASMNGLIDAPSECANIDPTQSQVHPNHPIGLDELPLGASPKAESHLVNRKENDVSGLLSFKRPNRNARRWRRQPSNGWYASVRCWTRGAPGHMRSHLLRLGTGAVGLAQFPELRCLGSDHIPKPLHAPVQKSIKTNVN